jgi:hypothetical protein
MGNKMLLIYNILYIYMGDDMNKRYVALGMVIAIVPVGTAGIPQAIAKGAEFDDGSAHAVLKLSDNLFLLD